jgi:hypothetical protein
MLSVTLTRHPVSALTPAPAVPALDRSPNNMNRLGLSELIEAVSEVALELHSIDFGGDTSDPAITAMLESVGLCTRGEIKWRGHTRDDVTAFLVHHIGHDLAYHKDQLETEERCYELAAQILQHTDPGDQWFANHSADLQSLRRGSYGWSPVSTWTFDACYVAIGERRSLCICFLAED